MSPSWSLKADLLWMRRFRTATELGRALIAFRRTYNENWLVERHGIPFVSPGPTNQMDKLLLAA